MEIEIGARVVVKTLDGHRFQGRLLDLRRDSRDRELAVLRLDSGWVTTYPASMVHAIEGQKEAEARKEP